MEIFYFKGFYSFYFIPFAWFKFIALDKIYKLFPGLKQYFANKIVRVDLTKYIFAAQDYKIISWQIKIIWLILFFIGIVSVAPVYLQLRGYFKLKMQCLDQTFSDPVIEAEMFQNAKNALGIKKEVKLVFSELCDTPFTIGVFHPTVIMPLTFQSFEVTDCRYMIEHELNHIKNHDIFLKFMALFAIAINWYNPICYVMYRELCNVSELYCDYCTTKELNSEQRKRYCNLIIDIATEDHKNVTKKYIATLVNNDAKIIKRRISELKKYGGPKKLFLSCFPGGIICVTGSVTSFAYNPPAIYNTTDAADTNTEIMVYNEVPPQLQADILKDSNPKAYCPHNHEPVTITKHTKYSNKSCKVVYLNGKKCNLCGGIIQGSVINTVHYDVCTH